MSLRFLSAVLEGAPGLSAFEAVRDRQWSRRVLPGARDAFLACGAAVANLDALLDGSALAVTTGQQAGLFTGPLYTVHKALTAAALAEHLEGAWGRKMVPVYWVAGDDHDFAEIATATVVAQDGALAAVTLRERPPEARMLPAFREPLGADVASALDRLEALLPPSEFLPGVLAWLRAAYAPERSMAEAHARAMAELLGSHGVVVLRGWHGALKQAAGSVLTGALERAAALDGALAAEADSLRARGREVPVEVGNGLALVMVEAAAGRDRLRIGEDGRFVARRSGEAFDAPALERIFQEDRERLSANVLLRPVVEAHAVPTVAYVGGPGELAYLAQTGPLFAAFEVPRPVPVPRLSGTLLDERTGRTLERLGLSAEDLARPEQDLAAGVLREALPESAVAALEALRRSVTDGFGAVAQEAASIDKTLARPVESARNAALGSAQEIEKKLLAALKRVNQATLQQLGRARTAVYPAGAPQERVLTLASFSARYGGTALDIVARAAREHAAGLLVGKPAET